MTRTVDVAVLGGGVVGASIAHHLAGAGVSVALVERSSGTHRSATSNTAGQIRLHHSDPADAQLAALSFGTFENWGEKIGGDAGFRRTGFAFLVGERHTDILRDNVKVLTDLGVEAIVLTPAEFADRHPGLNLDGVAAVAYEPRSGYADPHRTRTAFLDQARGVTVLTSRSGGRLLWSGQRVSGVDTGAERVAAGEVVLAAGAWSGALLGEFAPPLRTKRVGLIVADAGDLPAREHLPMVIDDLTGTYFRPAFDHSVLFGVPLEGWDTEPDDANDPPERDREAAARARIDRRLPGLARAPRTSAAAAADGYTPDGRALIGRLFAGLYLATGFNGGGFKVAPSVGRAVAAELTGAGDQPELVPYRPDRFAAGREPVAPIPRYATM
ncbi:NAD(P)/FAD-dependent oxidoreductase [Amycolatopsis pithecellobii]|uniref:NAD(P)/FAD-dependent oxidoreductase n=1 Tax=Amycolatopsis pithecellobii TaxID=664692 RepID=UPI00140BCD33|nr:FAD-binding oxidoreductase [Amycolatopsis pithecellobii]